jgi:hypothetical protein
MSTTNIGEYEVFLKSAGDNRLGVMATLRRRLDISPLEAKRLLDAPLTPIFIGSALQVSDWIDEFQGLGALVVVKPELSPIPLWMRSAPRSNARAHHYEFAHRALVSFFQQNPFDLWSLFIKGADAWLLDFWRRIGARLPPEERVEDTGLSLMFERLGHLEFAVITLPAPLAHAEAYFVALVRYPPQQGAPSGFFRYMTLERGFDMSSGGDNTMLCEWAEGHMNYGEGPPPTIEAFIQAIAGSQSSEPMATFTPDSLRTFPQRKTPRTGENDARSSRKTPVSAERSAVGDGLGMRRELRVKHVEHPLTTVTVVFILTAIAAFIIFGVSR